MFRDKIYYAPEGTGGGGAQGAAGATGNTGPLIPLDQQQATARLKELEAENATLKEHTKKLEGQFKEGASKLEELHNTIVSPEYLQYVAERRRGGAKTGGQQQPQQNEPQAPTVDELNSMDNAELFSHIGKLVQQAVTRAVQPLAAKTTEVDTQSQVRAAAEQFKDFWEYRSAMIAIAEKDPSLTPVKAYLQIKGMEAALGKSFKDAKPDGDDGGQSNATGTRPVARPASGETGSGPSGNLGRNREVPVNTYAEAAGDAYDAIFGRG